MIAFEKKLSDPFTNTPPTKCFEGHHEVMGLKDCPIFFKASRRLF